MILLQLSSADMNWIIGLGIMIGIAFFLNFFTTNSFKGFLIFLTFSCGFMVYAGIINTWVLILCIIITVIVMVPSMQGNLGMIMFSLIILLVLTVFSVVFGASFGATVIENVIDNSLIIDGITTTLEMEGADLLFNIDALTGALVWIIVIIALVSVIGINILGSGLSETSVHIITLGTAYTTIWIVLSLLASPLIFSIEIFGALIYVVLTIIYAFGFINKISGSDD